MCIWKSILKYEQFWIYGLFTFTTLEVGMYFIYFSKRSFVQVRISKGGGV